MWWFPHPMGLLDYVTMVIDMVLFWGLIIFGAIGLFRYLTSGNRPTTSRDTSERRRAERFARGEIGKQEDHRRLDVLRRRSSDH